MPLSGSVIGSPHPSTNVCTDLGPATQSLTYAHEPHMSENTLLPNSLWPTNIDVQPALVGPQVASSPKAI